MCYSLDYTTSIQKKQQQNENIVFFDIVLQIPV